MSNPIKSASNNKMKILGIGRIVILVGGFYFFKDLTKDSHFILAIVSSVVWFLSFYLYRKIPNKTGKSASLPAASITFGFIEIVIAVMLKTNIDLRTGVALWVIPTNLMGGIIGFLGLYNALIFNLYPDTFLSTYPPPSPDPIENLPTHIKEIINNGRVKVYKASVISIFLFLGIGILLLFFIYQFVQNPGLLLLSYVLVNILCFGAVAYLRQKTARRWQEEALESGIHKDTLEEAAKLGGVPWPKIKEE